LLQGYGQNYGTMTVAAINAMTLDNLHNGDLVIVTGISDQSPANVITLGNLTVRNGQNLIFHKQGTGAQATGEWQSIDGEFKLIQNPVDTDNASGSGKGGSLKTLVRLQQNGNGDITATFADIPTASASGSGLMTKELYAKLDALPTNANLAALINAKADKDTDAVPGNLAVFDENGNPIDSGIAPEDLAPASDFASKEEAAAAALDNLDARMRAVEEMAAAENMGDRKADSIDTQVLKIGGSDVSVELASIRNSLAGKQDSLSWMTDDEVDALFENAWNAAT
jgi:hypothetical protein